MNKLVVYIPISVLHRVIVICRAMSKVPWLVQIPRVLTHQQNCHESGRLGEEGAMVTAKPAEHGNPQEQVVHPSYDIRIHITQSTAPVGFASERIANGE